MALLSMKNAVIDLFDSNASHTVTLTAEDGDLTFTLPDETQHQPDRGSIGRLYVGEFQPIPISFNVQITDYTSTGTVTPADVVLGTATSWVYGKYATPGSGDYHLVPSEALQDDGGVDRLFNIRVSYTDNDTAAVERLFFINVTASLRHSEGLPNKWSIEGTSWMTAADFWALVKTS